MEANSTGGQGSRRAIAPSDDDNDDDDVRMRLFTNLDVSTKQKWGTHLNILNNITDKKCNNLLCRKFELRTFLRKT